MEEPPSKRLGVVIRRLRRERGLSQEALADAAHRDRTYIGMLERGKRRATLESAEAIAVALGLTLSALVREMDDQSAGAGSKRDG